MKPRTKPRLQEALFLCAVMSCAGVAACAAELDTHAIADPFAYCRSVTTDDQPRPVPGDLNARPPIDPHSYWRCMNRAVYVCAVGANIPCYSKADTAKHNVGAVNYCRENRDAAFVPAYAAGRSTLYIWSCAAGIAVRGRAAAKLDQRGFRIDFWHRVARADTVGTTS